MADYASEKGVKVQTVAGDPPAPFEGQVWYNSTTGSHRVRKQALVGTWSTGGNLNTGRRTLMGAGTQTAALGSGGSYDLSATESYNGTNWTEVNDLGTGRYGGGNGTNTSALVYGGYKPGTNVNGATDTESWNGTNWTELNDLNTARIYLQGTGADNTSAIASGGFTPPVSPVGGYAETESWNGTNWTEVNDLNTNRFHLAIAVKSIEESKEFYCDLMGCVAGDYEEGRWQDINFWGNELTLHHGPDEVASKKRHDVDMGTVSVPHFGAHLKEDEFFALKDRIEASEKFNYYDEPYRRFINKDREQETFFIQDPSGNVLEIKTMVNPETLWS